MTVDRTQWMGKFEKLPHWQCPTCKKGHLLPVKDKIWLEETGPSLAAHDHDAWDPDWIFNRFAGFLKCNMPGCAEIASISGNSPSDFFEYQDEHQHIQELESRFVVKSIDPSPIPIQLPDDISETLKEAICVASGLIWSSPEASGNMLRQAVEILLDDLKIPSSQTNGSRITLHDRIGEFSKKDNENGQILLATKWLGNNSSHPGGLTRDDVLDAFDMIEYVLESLFGTTRKDLLAKVAAVNAQKGPVKTVP